MSLRLSSLVLGCALAVGVAQTAKAQVVNLDFEDPSVAAVDRPTGWRIAVAGYQVELDEMALEGSRSLRINRVGEDGFGLAFQSVPAEDIRGSVLRLSGYVRTLEVGSGEAGLWLQIDGMGPQLFTLRNLADRLVSGTTDWGLYTVEVLVPHDAVEVGFGAIHTGSGTAWFDRFELEILPDPNAAAFGSSQAPHEPV